MFRCLRLASLVEMARYVGNEVWSIVVIYFIEGSYLRFFLQIVQLVSFFNPVLLCLVRFLLTALPLYNICDI